MNTSGCSFLYSNDVIVWPSLHQKYPRLTWMFITGFDNPINPENWSGPQMQVETHQNDGAETING